MDKTAMRATMVKHGDTYERLAEALDLPVSALSHRINGQIEFRASEICKVVRRYRLSPQETMDIFFEEVAS